MNYYISVASQPNISETEVAAQLQAMAYNCLDLDDLREECVRVEDSLDGSVVKKVLDLWRAKKRVQIIDYPGQAGQLTVTVKAEGAVAGRKDPDPEHVSEDGQGVPRVRPGQPVEWDAAEVPCGPAAFWCVGMKLLGGP